MIKTIIILLIIIILFLIFIIMNIFDIHKDLSNITNHVISHENSANRKYITLGEHIEEIYKFLNNK